MIKNLFKISYIIAAIVTCFAFTGTRDNEIPDFKVQKASLDQNGNISITIVLAKKLTGGKKNKLKVNVFQRNVAGTQLCTLSPNFSGEKNLKVVAQPCEPKEKKLKKADAKQKYKVEISLKVNNEESGRESAGEVTVDLQKFYPKLFEEIPAVNKGVITKAEGVRSPGPDAANTDHQRMNENVPALGLEEFISDGCKYLKIVIPSAPELNRHDVKLHQHIVQKTLTVSVSDNKKRIHKEDNAWTVYFIPNTNPQYSMKFSVDVKGKKYLAENKNINVKDIKDGDDCIAKLEKIFVQPQPPGPKPEPGFNFKSLLIPLVIVLLIGASWYTIMQYRQGKSNASRSLHKEPVAIVPPAPNAEEEIKFFEPGTLGSYSNANSIESSKYTKLADLATYYKDTAVANVFIEKGAAKEIFDFVWQSVQVKPSPEVGGFLMGNVQSNPERPGLNDVFINAFLKDMAPDLQNNVNISFSNGIAADELEYIDSHPGEEKVGWLHTHPGHGVFLSPTDIGSHFRAFPRATQMAIVIESYDNFKTGIFSYKAGAKELNNISDKSITNEFKSWKEFI